MKVLDLFSGLGGWSKAFKDRGHEVITIDIEPKFKPTICQDIMSITSHQLEKVYGHFDVILASPPCNCFSVASLYRHWKNGKPKGEQTIKAIELVEHTIKLINDLKPRFWILENPVGMLRKQLFMFQYERKTITQCQYGRSVMKPTDLWGEFPKSFIAKKCRVGNLCHEKASRSAKSGTQGIKGHRANSFENLGSANSGERAKLPYELSLVVCLACEKELL